VYRPQTESQVLQRNVTEHVAGKELPEIIRIDAPPRKKNRKQELVPYPLGNVQISQKLTDRARRIGGGTDRIAGKQRIEEGRQIEKRPRGASRPQRSSLLDGRNHCCPPGHCFECHPSRIRSDVNIQKLQQAQESRESIRPEELESSIHSNETSSHVHVDRVCVTAEAPLLLVKGDLVLLLQEPG
jgi:hypothetical protein